MKNSCVKLSLLTGVATLAIVSNANAAGFFLQEQSVSGLGSAYAGEAVVGRDASTVFFNPAAMTKLNSASVAGGVHILNPVSEVSDTGSTATVGGTTVRSGGADGGNPYEVTMVPNLFLAAPFMDNALWIGYGATAPFGLANDYGQTWFGRYDSTRTKLQTINHTLAAAYKFNDWLSIGGGLDYQTADAKLNRNAVAVIVLGNPIDAKTSLAGDDESFGWNAGLTLSPTQDIDIGLHYRSAINHELAGEVRVLAPSGTGTITPATAELNLPDIATLSGSWDVNDRWRALGSMTWYGWSNFEEIRVKRSGVADDVTTQGYEDTLAFSLGAEYKYSEDWVLRGGIQYDPTPTVDEFRTSRTPDGDRLWLTAGASHQINENLNLDLGAAYIDIANETINVTRTGAAAGRSSQVRANTEGSVGIVSFGLTYKF